MREFQDKIILRGGGGGGGGENCETWEKCIFFSSENERIGNSCRDGTYETLDFSLNLR